MADRPLMPKATAVWLIENSALTFKQIALFCGLHELEIQAIADGEVEQGIKGLNPINAGQLTREEISLAEDDQHHKLRLAKPRVRIPKTRHSPSRYVPISKRQDRPNAILWLTRNHPELKDAQIIRLLRTTKQTLTGIRDRSYWNYANLQPADPVTLGLTTQTELNFEVNKAKKALEAGQAADLKAADLKVSENSGKDNEAR